MPSQIRLLMVAQKRDTTMFPVRCYTCGQVLAHHHPEYVRRVHEGEHPKSAMEAFGITRMCCRRMFLGYVELTEEQSQFGNCNVVLDKGGTVLRRFVCQTRTASCE